MPEVGACSTLTRLRLRTMRLQLEERIGEALRHCHVLKELQVIFQYFDVPDYEQEEHSPLYGAFMVRILSSHAMQWVSCTCQWAYCHCSVVLQGQRAHSRAVLELLQGLLRKPCLTALQVGAVHAVLPLNVAHIAHLQHFALGCHLFDIGNTSSMPPATSSIHLLTVVRLLWGCFLCECVHAR